MIKKILNKLFGSKSSKIKLEEFDSGNFIHRILLGEFIETNAHRVNSTIALVTVNIPELYTLASGYLLSKNISLEYSQMANFIVEHHERSIKCREFLNTCEYFSPTISGTDTYTYGSENKVKILPKRDSKGRFSK